MASSSRWTRLGRGTHAATSPRSGSWKPGQAPSFTSRSRRPAGRQPRVGPAPRPRRGQLVHAPLGVDALAASALAPRAVGAELPRQHVVGEVDRRGSPAAGPAAPDVSIGATHLDALVEVAGHEVGRADVVRRPAGAGAVAEAVDAGVLEVAAEDRADPDVLRQARHAGAQAADAPQDQVDLHAGLAGARRGASIMAGSISEFSLNMMRPAVAVRRLLGDEVLERWRR